MQPLIPLLALLLSGPGSTVAVGPYLLAPATGKVHVRWLVSTGTCGQLLVEGETVSRQVQGKVLHQPLKKYKLLNTVCGADLEQLAPCARYRYRLTAEGSHQAAYEFQAPPQAGASCPGGVRLLVYGDTRTNHLQHAAVVPHLQKAGAHLLLHIGDLLNHSNKPEEWYKFFEIEKQFLPTAPLALTPGNHEGWPDFDMGVAAMTRFFRVKTEGGVGSWSFDYGLAHILVIDLYLDGALYDDDILWIEKRLGAVPEGRFKFVLLHEPPYSFGRHKPRSQVVKLRQVFKQAGVHAVFAGHSHHYEHFKVEGIHYLTVGGGGAPFHTPRQNVVAEQEKYFVKAAKVHHFLTVDLEPSGAKCVVHDTDNNKVLDSWTIPFRKTPIRSDAAAHR